MLFGMFTSFIKGLGTFLKAKNSGPSLYPVLILSGYYLDATPANNEGDL